MSIDKEQLRALYRGQYAHTATALYTASASLLIDTCPIFVSSQHVLAYSPIPTLEIPCIDTLRERYSSKKWYFPEVISRGEMVFSTETGELYADTARTCVITPSLALRADGVRLGKGGGYYDMFFAQHPSLIKSSISVVPDFAQLHTSYTPEAHDITIAYPLFATVSL
jgi:5-formyltetrahydrofolate cyclo-ligase